MQLHDERDRSKAARRLPLKTWLKRKWLWGLTYYPMIMLLAFVLVSVHIVEYLGLAAWFVAAGTLITALVYAHGDWCRLLRPGIRKWEATSLATICMVAISGAYAVVHYQSRANAKKQTQAWQQDSAKLASQPTAKPNAWQPIAIQAVIEEPLRYRRSTTPRTPAANTSDPTSAGADDLSSGSDQHWQTLTRVRIRQARAVDGWQAMDAVASLVVDEKVVGLYPGDIVELYGQWRAPPEPSNPGQFDLRKRYAELGIAAQLRAESGKQLLPVGTSTVVRMDRPLAMITEYALSTIERYVPFGQAPLTAALVLGQREQAHWQLQEELLATGTIHMLSISGMHIEMVAVALIVFGLMLRLPRSVTLLGTVLICGLYALLCGANPPVARATLMLTAACLARWMGWQFTSLNILATAALLLMSQRASIAFEIGTQLSFLAVAVLILTFPILNQRRSPLQRLLESRQTRSQVFIAGAKRFAWESLRSSFWVCFLTAPLVWSNFHILSPIAIVLNLVLWLPMLVALLSGLTLIVLGWIPPIAALLGALCGGALWILTQCVAIAEDIPLSHFWRAPPPPWWLPGFYIIALTIVIWRGTRRSSARRLLARSLVAWFLLGLTLEPMMHWWQGHFTKDHSGTLAVTWIDVGHGTSAVLEMPNGEFWLYDAGRLGDHERSYQPIINALWHLGYSRIDRMVLSHADSDHYNAMPGVAKRFFPREFTTTESVLESNNPTLLGLFDLMRSQSVRVEAWKHGDRYYGRGGWDVEILHPKPEHVDAPKWSDNAKSLCLIVRYAGRIVFLPGDLEPPGTQSLMEHPPVRCDVMMAPHHGSLAAKAERLIAWAQPAWVVISGSSRAVSPRVIDALSPERGQLLITARDHAIRVEIDALGVLKVMQWNSSGWKEIPWLEEQTLEENPL